MPYWRSAYQYVAVLIAMTGLSSQNSAIAATSAMKLERFRTPTEERLALRFGNQKINLHEWGKEFAPRAHVAVPGSLDLCFIAAVPLADVIAKLNQLQVKIIEGPVAKTGAVSKLRSVYVRDPDLNLVEISEPA